MIDNVKTKQSFCKVNTHSLILCKLVKNNKRSTHKNNSSVRFPIHHKALDYNSHASLRAFVLITLLNVWLYFLFPTVTYDITLLTLFLFS